MTDIDLTLLLTLNGWVGHSWTFDHLVALTAYNYLLKTGVLVALLWWCWEDRRNRAPALTILRTLAGAVVAIAVARGMQNFLPPRLRPIHDPQAIAAGLITSDNVVPEVLRDMSSFPSDHAVLAFALATAAFLIHRGIGVFALAWALVISCLPRVYFGMHYPFDVLGGAVVGIAVMVMAMRWPLPVVAAPRVAQWVEDHRSLFYAALFLFTYQMATLFVDTRNLVRAGSLVLKLMFAQP